jgi:hypothetical protein
MMGGHYTMSVKMLQMSASAENYTKKISIGGNLLYESECKVRNHTCPVEQDGHSALAEGLSLDQSQDNVPCPSPEHVTSHSLFLLVVWPLLDLAEMYGRHSIQFCNFILRNKSLFKLQ